MKHSLLIEKTFRPELEKLEARNLLSADSMGLPLPVPVPFIQQAVSQLNTDVATMSQDYNAVVAIAAVGGSPGTAPANVQNQSIQDYTTLFTDLQNIQSLNSAIQMAVSEDLSFEFFLVSTGSINLNNPQQSTAAVNAFDALVFSSIQANQDLSAAQGIAAANPGHQYPSLDEYVSQMSH